MPTRSSTSLATTPRSALAPTWSTRPASGGGVHGDQPRALLGDEHIGADNALLQLREHAILTRALCFAVAALGAEAEHDKPLMNCIVTLSGAKGSIST